MSVEILMPSLDPSMHNGRIVKWLITAGDPVNIGDPVVEIETDKAVFEVEAEVAGVLGEIRVAEGEYADVNSVIGIIREDGSDVIPSKETPAPAQPAGERKKVAPVPSPAGHRVFASPLARRLAALEGIELSGLSGSGPKGRIVKIDVERASSSKSAPATVTPLKKEGPLGDESGFLPAYESIPHTAMRLSIARRLVESSREIPHYYLTLDCEMDALMDLRVQVNDGESVKISANDFFIRAAAIALREVPAANAAWTENAILRFSRADISVAVSVEGGLITPVVRDAGGKGLALISAEARQLAEKARAGKLHPEEYKGGTFTISNLGMFGIKHFTSIINPPQGAILSIGAVEERPIVKEGQIRPATMMTVTLAVDHRCIDGATGAEFLAAFRRLIEKPVRILL